MKWSSTLPPKVSPWVGLTFLYLAWASRKVTSTPRTSTTATVPVMESAPVTQPSSYTARPCPDLELRDGVWVYAATNFAPDLSRYLTKEKHD